MEQPVELTIVMPCLNEAETLAACINKAKLGFERARVRGEIVVADNGSIDGSVDIARQMGARVVNVAEKGYGNALKGGIRAAAGRWVVMGDADDSYDFSELAPFVEKLRQGFEMVMGCRLPSGGGRIMPGAMPSSHRWLGNPMFTLMARHMFASPIHDVYCGLRAFSKDLYERLDLRCQGMEFATEMIIKASLNHARITEVPITLHRDGRISHAPHLKTVRDGWRTLRFFLVLSPRWLFLIPGLLLAALGVAGYAVALPGLSWRGINFDVHTLAFASLALLLGFQSILFGLFAKTFAINEGILPEDTYLKRFFDLVYLERGLLAGGGAMVFGLVLLGRAVVFWWAARFGNLNYPETMRWVIPGITLTALGFQTILGSFFVSILGLKKPR